MMLLGIGIAVISWGAGVWMGVLWSDHTVAAMKIMHKLEMDVIFEEVTRARAQIANLIGKE